jgi:hypothetical protein
VHDARADGGDGARVNGHVPDSFIATFPAAGTYYWQAVYTGDANNNPAVSACGSEVLTVTPLAPTSISTSLFRTSISAGGTDYDSATLSGGTPDAGGYVMYTVYSDSGCTVAVQDAGTVLVFNGHVPLVRRDVPGCRHLLLAGVVHGRREQRGRRERARKCSPSSRRTVSPEGDPDLLRAG